MATINTETISVSINFPCPGVCCSIITDYVHDDRFTRISNYVITGGTCMIQKYHLRNVYDISVKSL